MESSGIKFVTPTASVVSTSGDESNLTFMDSGISCLVFHSNNLVTSRCRHLKTDTEFIKARKWNYQE